MFDVFTEIDACPSPRDAHFPRGKCGSTQRVYPLNNSFNKSKPMSEPRQRLTGAV
jgi:hypothetical protein